jgi:Flp pilus assembly protein TadG
MTRRRAGSAGWLRDRGGNAAVEFALVLPLFLTLIIGVMELGQILLKQNALQRAVEIAARCASVDKTNCATPSQVQSFAATQATGVTVPPSAFTATAAACGNQVSAALPYTYLTTFLPLPPLTLRARACFPI